MMKKFLYVFAFAALASCSNDELVDVAPKQAITFGNAFVENATRVAVDPSYNNSAKLIESFQVYGTVTGNDNTVNIFDGDNVTKPQSISSGYNTSTAWICNEIQYWVPSCTYNFTAIVDGSTNDAELNSITTGDNGMPTSITYDAISQKDLLLATATVNTDDSGIPNTASNNTESSIAPVPFTFKHLLSKVKFTVKNTMSQYDETSKTGTNMYSYKVSNVRITNAVQKGTVAVANNNAWTVASPTINYTEENPLSFGNVLAAPNASDNIENAATAISEGSSAESHYERLLIPYNYTQGNELNVQFTVDILVNGESVNTKNYKANLAIELKNGNAYNFYIELALDKQIKFTVNEVTDWVTDPNGGTEGNDNEKELTEVEVTVDNN